jgi:hypothetical protein
MDIFSVIKEGVKALRKTPILLVIYLAIFLAFYFASKVVGSNPPIFVQIAFFVLDLLIFLGLLVYLTGYGKKFPKETLVEIREYKENIALHQNLSGEWSYVEIVEDENDKKQVNGKIHVDALDEWQFELNGQAGETNQSWSSIRSGWVGEKIFVYYRVQSMGTRLGNKDTWDGFVILNVIYKEKKVARLEGTFYTIGQPRIGTISFTRLPA